MNGRVRLSKVASSTPRMARALPDLPMDGTVMVRLLRICGAGLNDFFEPVFRSAGLSEHSFHVLCLLVATPFGTQDSSMLRRMADAQGLIVRAPFAPAADEGDACRVLMLR